MQRMRRTSTWWNISKEARRSVLITLFKKSQNWFDDVGWKIGECSWMVSFTSRLWVLVIRYRRQYPTHEPAISRSIRSSRCRHYQNLFLIYLLTHLSRSTQTVPYQLGKLTSAPSALTLPLTPHLLHLPPNTSLSPWIRSKTLGCMRTSTIRSTCRYSRASWTRSYLGCCGISIGWTLWVRAPLSLWVFSSYW